VGDPASEALLGGLDDEVGSVGSQDTNDTDSDTEAAIEEVSSATPMQPAGACVLSTHTRLMFTH
jgi:hypothetical protein